MIEYLEGNGYRGASWNPYTGCLHTAAQCPVWALCWARDISKRFSYVCKGDFTPRLHPARLDEPYHWRTPRRVAVAFMGDLWGNWRTCQDADVSNTERAMRNVRQSVLERVGECPRHNFLFLTKAPEQYAEISVWPANAWVGITLTGAETPEHQAQMLEALGRVQGAGVRWLSYEPAIQPLAGPLPAWMDWVVLGGWSGKRPVSEAGLCGLLGVLAQCQIGSVPAWEKSNLAAALEAPLHQKLPHVDPCRGASGLPEEVKA